MPSLSSLINGTANDPTLEALSEFNTNGILTQTATSTFAGRTISSGSGISVTNGNGVSGNPTIAADFASQAEAETGTNATKLMNPLRTAQAIATQASAGLVSMQVFTSSGTWNRPAGVKRVLMFVTGGGGGGGNNNSEDGGCGGTAIKFLDVTNIASSTITVGAGGLGNSSNGSAGANSSWSDGTNTITGTGGGAPGTGSPGNGGLPTGGDINIRGDQGSGATFWGSGVSTLSNVYGVGGPGLDSGSGSNGAPGIVWILEFK